MQRVKATLLVAAALTVLLVAGDSGSYGCTKLYACAEYIRDGSTWYKDNFTDVINASTSLVGLRRVANSSVGSINDALRGWQITVVLLQDKYLRIVDNSVRRFEDAHEARYYNCSDYEEVLDYVFNKRKEIAFPITSLFPRKMKLLFNQDINKKSMDFINQAIAKCRKDSSNERKYKECLVDKKKVQEAKDILINDRGTFCIYCKGERDMIVHTRTILLNIFQALRMVSNDIKDNTRCQGY